MRSVTIEIDYKSEFGGFETIEEVRHLSFVDGYLNLVTNDGVIWHKKLDTIYGINFGTK